MEKFFIIEDEKLKKQFIESKKNEKILHEVVKQVCDAFDIKEPCYYVTSDRLTLSFNREDYAKYPNDFKKDSGTFKINSPQNKLFKLKLSELGYKNVSKPLLSMMIHTFGRTSSTQFIIDDIYYGSINSELDFSLPSNFREIKASEYYKVVEDYNERQQSKES